MSRPLLPADASANSNVMGSLVGFMNNAKEKWDSSGANEAMGRMTASIPDSTKAYVAGAFKREHIRGVTVFFGIGEERPYYIEKNVPLLVERVRHNLTFFYLNYMIVTIILFCLTVITSPLTIVGVALLVGAWMAFIRATASGSLTIGAVQVPQKTASIAMAAVSALYLFWLFKSVFWWTLFSSGFLILIHTLLRDASLHKDMDDVMVMEGDLHLHENDAFLNPARVDVV